MESSERHKPTSEGNVFYVGGAGNVVAGRDVIQVQKAPVVRHVIQPGPEHISEAEKLELRALCTEWVELHRTLKKQALSYGMAWAAINKEAGATSYHLILKERLPSAVKFIRRQMAMLRSMRSAPSKDDQWRSKRIAAIKLRSKNQLGDPDAYKPYIRKNFNALSLADLATDQLQRTYSYIMAKKAAGQ